jgi:ribosomal protein S18 acetylase RimI-like enzyme
MYSLRAAELTDVAFLKLVHHLTLREHISKIWGWNEELQDQFLIKDFESGRIQIIKAFGKDVGYLILNVGKDAIHIVDILILPQFQNRGLGSEIIKNLMAKTRDDGLLLKLGVFKVNERAKKLYENLGFKIIEETATHFMMKFQHEQ